MFLDQDYKGLTKAQLQERLKALRSHRERAYKKPIKGISTKGSAVSGLDEVDSKIAAKILEDLLATLEAN